MSWKIILNDESEIALTCDQAMEICRALRAHHDVLTRKNIKDWKLIDGLWDIRKSLERSVKDEVLSKYIENN